jgi:glycosyltransferase involved in cell wall biosynthesis
MVAPSRAESMPYIVLETLAARVPLLTTDVGGIPEIFGPFGDRLMPPDDPAELARRILDELARSPAARARRAEELAMHVQALFSVDAMAEAVIAAYREALGSRSLDARALRRGAAAGAQLVNEA